MRNTEEVLTSLENTATQLENAAKEDGKISVRDITFILPIFREIPILIQSLPGMVDEVTVAVKESRPYKLAKRFIAIGKLLELPKMPKISLLPKKS